MSKGLDECHALLFSPWVSPGGQELFQFIAVTITDLMAAESRQRSRSSRAQTNFDNALSVLLCNLALSVPVDPLAAPRPVAVPVSLDRKKTRYDWEPLPALRQILGVLEERGFLVRNAALRPGLMQTVVLTPEGKQTLRAHGIGPDCVTWSSPREILTLSTKLKRNGRMVRVPLDYRDNATTRRLRAELKAINSHLTAAQLDFMPDIKSPQVRTDDRVLVRRFNLPPRLDGKTVSGRGFKWNSGGRLFGGWWHVEKVHRHLIRIDGEPVADLDYSGMFPRLASLEMGAGVIDGDPYDVPGLGRNRKGIKKLINAMLFARPALRSWPHEISKQDFEGLTLKEARERIHHRHPFMAQAEGRGIGFSLMCTESEILVASLMAMNAEGISAVVSLPTSRW